MSHNKGKIKVKLNFQHFQLNKGHNKLIDEFRIVSVSII